MLERYVRQEDEISIDKYLSICEQLGEEPDPNKMPLETSDFPTEVQVAFFIFGFLEDRWEGMSGTYMGKTWNNLEYLFTLYDPDNKITILYFMKMWEEVVVSFRANKSEQRRKAEESKSASGGKTFTHNVKG